MKDFRSHVQEIKQQVSVRKTVENREEGVPDIQYNITNKDITFEIKPARFTLTSNGGTDTHEAARNTADSIEKRIKKAQDEFASALKKIKKDFS